MTDFRHQWRAALTSETSPATSTQRLVGLVLAEFANRDTGLAYPAVATLELRTRLGDKAVRTALRELVEHGFLTASPRHGKVTRYVISLPDPGTRDRTTPVRGTDLPRFLDPQTPVRQSGSAVPRTDEPLKRLGEEPGAPSGGARLEGSPPPDDAEPGAFECPICSQPFPDNPSARAKCLNSHLDENLPRSFPRFVIRRPKSWRQLKADEHDERGSRACPQCDDYDVPRYISTKGTTLCDACLIVEGLSLVDGDRWDDDKQKWRPA